MPAKRRHSAARKHFDDIVTGFITAALWATDDDDGEPLERNYDRGDIAPEAMKKIKAYCAKFYKARRSDLLDYREMREYDPSQGSVYEYAGHDLFLSSAGHGTGFWDRGLGALGDRLHEAAEKLGELNFYVGDDGKIYV